MKRTLVCLILLVGLMSGCGYRPSMRAEPVDVRGKVTFADGSPVTGLVLAVQPTGQGHPNGFALGAGGEFSGKLIPGTYIYYFQVQGRTPAERQEAEANLKRVPAKYHDAHIDHQVSLSGSEATIKLTN